MPTFYETITAAINDMVEHGFDSVERVSRWIRTIRSSANETLVPTAVLEANLTSTFRGIYTRLVEKGQILKWHGGIDLFTYAKVKPKLRAELDRRIVASRDLIKLNREQAVADTTQRFQGWATSIPVGGTDTADRAETKARIRKPLASLPYEERRVATDQGHKFIGNLHTILATDSGALAGRWSSHWRQPGYKYRKDHKERDDHLYVVRDNWALKAGLMKPAGHLYTDDITAPGEEVNCRCSYNYIYGLRSLPPEMLTEKGRAELQKVSLK